MSVSSPSTPPHTLDQQTVTADSARRLRRRSRSQTVFLALLVAGVVGLGGAAGVYALGQGDDTSQTEQKAPTSTAPVTLGNLSGSSTKTGTLTYAGTRLLSSSLTGILTGVPASGATVTRGGQLFAVDNTGVYLMHGALPAWRVLGKGMADGPDVQQLEENLVALGHLSGAADAHFSNATSAAVKRWQKATGQEQTGTVELGRIVFSHGDLRIGTVELNVGDAVDPAAEILEVSGLDKEVTLDLKLADQRLAIMGGPVSIELPGGTTTTGKIMSVGVPVERGTDDKKETVVPVTVALDDPAATGDLQRASVSVSLPSETRENVLSVPVEALLALDDTQFGVEVVQRDGTTRRVPVTTGLFAAGRVEISGDDVAEGQEVVVPDL